MFISVITFENLLENFWNEAHSSSVECKIGQFPHFQLSRYGYENLDHLKSVVEEVRNADIPLDVIYADIEYMHRYNDFSVGEVNFDNSIIQPPVKQITL